MDMKEEFNKLIEKLKTERDVISLKIHLASMDAKQEYYAEAEKKWIDVKAKAATIADDAEEVSEEFIAKAKVVCEELKETYSRISSRLSK